MLLCVVCLEFCVMKFMLPGMWFVVCGVLYCDVGCVVWCVLSCVVCGIWCCAAWCVVCHVLWCVWCVVYVWYSVVCEEEEKAAVLLVCVVKSV